MSLGRKLLWLLPAMLVAGESWALGLGDIRLNSALNEPLRAEIELVSATPEELENLKVELASSETFERYDIDRPLFLTDMQFDVVASGGTEGNYVRVTTPQPVSEPFVTFLVEASWARGKLLREYTLLLDPPTFAPPPTRESTQTLSAPSRATTSDSGTIQRPAPQPQSQPAPPRSTQPAPAPQQAAPQQTGPFDTSNGGEYRVQRGDTLWAIAQSVKPDERLGNNQTMIAIYEANPQAFAGNINLLSAGAILRIPSADEIFRISRGDALSEVQQQTQAWSGGSGTSASGPSLTLRPPDTRDGGVEGTVSPTSVADADAAAREEISRLERQVEDQESLLTIQDNELAALRDELARLRGQLEQASTSAQTSPATPEPDTAFVDESASSEEPAEAAIEEPVASQEPAQQTDTAEPPPQEQPTPTVVSTRPDEPGIVDTIIGFLTSIWGLIGAALIVVLGVLVWFARRAGGGAEDASGVWEALDADDSDMEDYGEPTLASTERLSALAREEDESMIVVEQETGTREALALDETIETDAPEATDVLDFPAETAASTIVEDTEAPSDTDTARSLEDTFSSETAINLDQSDPIAEADFHMAYGLYDQAADLINGALAIEPEREDLISKLCEIYFVWGNRDGFVDAAEKMRAQITDDTDPSWSKVVIMGQQIAPDHAMFSGASADMTRAVDLSLEAAHDDGGKLDIDFASAPDGTANEMLGFGADAVEQDSEPSLTESSSIDFPFEGERTESEVTAEMPNPSGLDETLGAQTITSPADDVTIQQAVSGDSTIDQFGSEETVEQPVSFDETAEAPTLATEATVESPTLEQQFESLDATSELPSLSSGSESTEIASFDEDRPPVDATAEINLDDLGLDLEALAESAIDDDMMDETEEAPAFGLDDNLASTGKNPQVAGMPESTGMHKIESLQSETAETSEMPGLADRTGENATIDDDEVTLDASLLDATGETRILSEDDAMGDEVALSDDEKTLVAGLDDEEPTQAGDDPATLEAPLDDEFDVDESIGGRVPNIADTDETSRIAGATDMDLDLDDLTAALQVSEMEHTLERPLDEPTAEQPMFSDDDKADLDADVSGLDGLSEAERVQEDMGGDLHDARTMTEVGTKLDLARAYVDMGDPGGARSILEEVLDEGDDAQRQQAQQLLDSLPT